MARGSNFPTFPHSREGMGKTFLYHAPLQKVLYIEPYRELILSCANPPFQEKNQEEIATPKLQNVYSSGFIS